MSSTLSDRALGILTDLWNSRPTCDFIVTYHPEQKNLFLATGGSGHGFKFLPVIGEKIVDAIEGKLESEFARLWKWPNVGCGFGIGEVWLVVDVKILASYCESMIDTI